MDIDGDGIDDIIVALTEVTAIKNEIKKDKNRPQLCQSLNLAAVLFMVYVVMILLYYGHFELNNLYSNWFMME
jgi:hypothetical protein